MKFKKPFILICIIICLFAIASVCASDANETTISAIDTQDNLELSEKDSVNDSIIGYSLNEPQEDNMEISTPETVNSDSDKLSVSYKDYKYASGADLRANVTALNVTAADNALFIVDVEDAFNGNVSIKIGSDALYDGHVKTIIKTAKLPAGNYVATAAFYGDDNYKNLTLENISFTVSRLTPTIEADIDDVTYPNTAYAVIHIGNNANGTVNVTIDGKTFNETVNNGYANVTISGLSAGYKEAKIEFYSRDYYNNNVTTSTKFIVYPNNSLIEVRHDPIFNVGNDIEINIKTHNSTGDLSVYINGELYKNALPYPEHRNYDLAISDRHEGTYVIEFRLDKDENFTGYDTHTTVIVVKNDISIDITDINEVIYVGSPITFTAKLDNAVTGNVIFTINGANYTEYVNNADVVTHLYTPVNNETLTVTATFTGNDVYNAKTSTSREFNVTRIATSVDVDFNSPINAGDDVQINVTMNPGINCTVKLNVNDKSYDVAIVEGNGVYTISNLADATYNIKAVFAGDDKYANSTSEVKQLFVNKIATSVDVDFYSPITAGDDAQIYVTMNPGINCTVKLNVNDKSYDVGIVEGYGVYSVSNLADATYNIKAVFAGDDKYANSTSEVKQLFVNKVITNLNISIDKTSMSYKDNAVLSVVLDQSINAIVTVKVNGNNHTVGLVNGKGSFNLYGLHKDNYTINAVFAGDDKYIGRTSNTVKLTVTGDNITSSVSISLNKDSVFVGDDVKITINSNPTVTGVIKLNIGSNSYNVAVNKGVGTFTTSNLSNGTYNIQAIFEGDDMHTGNSSDIKQLEVKKIPTTLSISIDKPSTFVGDNIKITINSNPTVTGAIKLNIGSNPYNVIINNGIGTFTTSTLANGVYNVQAIFEGDNKYIGNSSDIKQLEVKKIPTTLSISIDKPSTFVGDNVKITINSNPTVTGAIKLNIGSNPYNVIINNGIGTFTTSNLANGTYNVQAIFEGDNKYIGSSSGIKKLEVKKAPTNLSISIDKASTFVGDDVKITINSNPTVAGVIKLNIGSDSYNVIVNNGIGTFTTSTLANGTYNVQAIFEGDNKHLGNSSDIKQLEVKKIPTTLSISIDKPSTFVGGNVKITVNSNPTVTGVIKLNIGPDTYNVAINKGTGTFTTPNLANGTYNVQAIFEGDDKHLGNSSDIKQIVANKISTKLSVSIDKVSITVGDKAVVSVALNQTINNIVTVKVNDKNYIVGIVDGKGTLTLSDLESGNYTINALFANDEKYHECSSNNVTLEVNKITTKLTASAITATYNIEKSLVITLKDDKNNPLIGLDVTVNLKGIHTLTTDGKGQVKISTEGLAPKTSYTAKITFEGNAKYIKSTKSVTVTVKKATPKLTAKSKTFKATTKIKKYTVTLKTNENKEMKNTEVSIVINGKTYVAKTNKDGVATFKIKKLTKKGTFESTVTYKGDKYYNKVTKTINIKIK